jgi:hypothetical protein
MVQGVNDSMMQGPTPYMVVLEPAVSSDPRFNGIAPSAVSLTNVDNKAGLVITPLTNYDSASALYQTSEDGAKASFQVSLSTRPSQPVTVTLSIPSPGSDQAAASPTQVTFTSANYLMPQTVTLTGNDDFLLSANSPYTVHFSLSSADSHFNGLNVPDLHAVNLEDGEDAGIILTPLSGFVSGEFFVAEIGAAATFSLKLVTIPTDVVTVTLSDQNQFLTISPETLNFLPDSSALNPQVVSVSGKPLTNLNEDAVTLLMIVATINDSNFNTISHPNLVALNLSASARPVLLSNKVSVVDQVLKLYVGVNAPDVYYTTIGKLLNPPYLLQVTVKNVNSFAIQHLAVTSTSLVGPDNVTVPSKPAQTTYSTNTTGSVVDIFNLPAQGTISLSYQIPPPDDPGNSVVNGFSVVADIGSSGMTRTFVASATTAFKSGAVEWLFLAGLGLLAGGRALERYLRRRRKRQADAADLLDVQSS